MKFKWYLNGGGGFNPHCSKVLHLLFLYKVNNLIIRIQKGLKTSNLDFVFWKYCGKIERGKIDNFEKNDANIYILFKKKKRYVTCVYIWTRFYFWIRRVYKGLFKYLVVYNITVNLRTNYIYLVNTWNIALLKYCSYCDMK